MPQPVCGILSGQHITYIFILPQTNKFVKFFRCLGNVFGAAVKFHVEFCIRYTISVQIIFYKKLLLVMKCGRKLDTK